MPPQQTKKTSAKPTPNKKIKPKKKKRLWLWIVLSVFLLAGGVFGTWALKVASAFQTKGTSIVQVWQGITDPLSLFPGQTKFNLLLVGKDFNYTSKGILYTKNARADTIMLLSVDLIDKKVSAISIPRDTRVQAQDGTTGKINATLARGGVDLLKGTISELFDVPIDYHVMLKPTAVKEIVDAVGQIEVETLDEMHYDDNWAKLHIHLPKGKQTLNGEQAVGFVRFREINYYVLDERGRKVRNKNAKHSLEEGDLRRTARQQQLIQALMHSANTPSNLIRLDEIINTGFEQIETNLDRTQFLALATLFRGTGIQLKGETLPGEDSTQTGAYYYILDHDRSRALVDWLIKGDASAVNRIVRVSVKNGTQVRGLAKATASKLTELGYNVMADGNTKEPQKLTKITYSKAAYLGIAEEIKKILNIPLIEKEAVPQPYKPEIVIMIGDDFAAAMTGVDPSQKMAQSTR